MTTYDSGMPGQFIVLEGPDGSGTTTHAKLLAESLTKRGHEVVVTAEPTDQPIGKFIRTELKKTGVPSPASLQLLFCADRAQHVEQLILPALKEGKTVICDRYIPSTIIYGAALGLDAAWLMQVNAHFPKADVMFFLLPGIEACKQRIGHRKEHDVFEKAELQKKVYEGYEQVARNTADTAGIHVIDSSAPKELVAKQISDAVS